MGNWCRCVVNSCRSMLGPQSKAAVLFKKSLFYFAILIIAAAIISSLFRALTPWAAQYRGDLEQRLSKFIGNEVNIDAMETSWYWFHPVIKLQGLSLKGPSNIKPVVEVKKIFIGLDVFRSIWHWQIEPGMVYIEGANLSIVQKGRYWQILGLSEMAPASKKPLNALTEHPGQAGWTWLLAQGTFILKDVQAHVQLNDKSTHLIKRLNLILNRRGERYKLQAQLYLDKLRPRYLDMKKALLLGPISQRQGNLNKPKAAPCY